MENANPQNQLPKSSTIVRPRPKSMIIKALDFTSKFHPELAVRLGLKAFFTPLERSLKNSLLPTDTQITDEWIRGYKLKLYRYGNSPRRVLLAHGWEGAASSFHRFFEPLKEAGFEVWAVDFPGHGLSPKGSINAIIASEIIRDLEVQHGPFSGIVGHSFGGFSTGYAISRFPEMKDIPVVTIGAPNKLSKILDNFSNTVRFSKLQAQYVYTKVERDLNIRVKEIELGRYLKQHQGPSMVVQDKQDKVVDIQVVDEIKSQSEKPSFLITEGLGHSRILNDKTVINKVIDFLSLHTDERPEVALAEKFGLV